MSEEFPQSEIEHCYGCHDEWNDYDNGIIDHEHSMDTELKDGRSLVYCCRAIDWFEKSGLLARRRESGGG